MEISITNKQYKESSNTKIVQYISLFFALLSFVFFAFGTENQLYNTIYGIGVFYFVGIAYALGETTKMKILHSYHDGLNGERKNEITKVAQRLSKERGEEIDGGRWKAYRIKHERVFVPSKTTHYHIIDRKYEQEFLVVENENGVFPHKRWEVFPMEMEKDE